MEQGILDDLVVNFIELSIIVDKITFKPLDSYGNDDRVILMAVNEHLEKALSNLKNLKNIK